MAKLNVGQTNANVIQAFKNALGAVRMDAAQELTNAQKEQARENIAAGSQTDTTNLLTRIGAAETELNVLDARMDAFASLPSGSTSGNAELIDIRIGADGKTYASAGDAVRGQVTGLQNEVTVSRKIENNYANARIWEDIAPTMFEVGNIGTNMVYDKSVKTRIMTAEGILLHLLPGDIIGLTDYSNAKFFLRWVKLNGSNTNNSWRTTDFIVEEEAYYGIVVANSTEVTISDINTLANLVFIKTHYSLEDMAAGKYILLSSDFTQGTYIPSTHKMAMTESKRITALAKVKKGQIIVGESTTQYMYYHLYDSSGTDLQHSATFERKFILECQTDGLFCVNVATGATYNDSASITPADFAANIFIYNCGVGDLFLKSNNYKITQDYFLQGIYNTSLTLLTGEHTRISAKIPVKKGDVIYLKKCNHYLFTNLLNNGSFVDTTKPQKAPYQYICPEAGTLCIMICTAYNYSDCVNIVPTDFIGELLYIPCQNAEFVNDSIEAFSALSIHNIKTVDHRGFTTKAPENTLPAFALAKANGFEWVETDIQLTSDGVPVLLHDSTIDRTSNGTGSISNMTLQQVQQYDFSKGYDAYSNIKIPTLEEFLIYCKFIGLKAIIELKTDHIWTQSEINNVVSLVKKYMPKESVIYTSFSFDALNYVITADPSASVAYVQNTVTAQYIEYTQSLKTGNNNVYFSADYNSIRNNVSLLNDSGLGVIGWTVEQNSIVDTTSISPIIDFIMSTDIKVSNVLIREVMSEYTYQV